MPHIQKPVTTLLVLGPVAHGLQLEHRKRPPAMPNSLLPEQGVRARGEDNCERCNDASRFGVPPKGQPERSCSHKCITQVI